jgi:hypothetical protein
MTNNQVPMTKEMVDIRFLLVIGADAFGIHSILPQVGQLLQLTSENGVFFASVPMTLPD